MDIGALAQRLKDQGFIVEDATEDAVFARKPEFRWSWLATSLTVYVAARAVEHASLEEWMSQEATASAYAVRRWRGVRGFQMGYAVLPILLAQDADQAVTDLVEGPMKLEWSRFTVRALRLPQRFSTSRFPRMWGKIYHPYLKGILASLLDVSGAPKTAR